MFSVNSIFNINTDYEFEQKALDAFIYQIKNNLLYQQYVNAIGINPHSVNSISVIPYLPIELFKSHKILIGENYDKVFFSSGTTGLRSKHYIKDIGIYETSFSKGFFSVYGEIKDYTILALLPSYIENGDSSLVYMVDALIKETGNDESGFYLYNYKELHEHLSELKKEKRKVILFGVTHALIEFGAKYKCKYPNLIIIETGGMKGLMKEITKSELYLKITEIFGTENIHSEYGMTELLSQGYSQSENVFKSVPWMKITIRDLNDPFSTLPNGKIGAINIIDLANWYSCPFIETKDIGIVLDDGCFQVLGRVDNADVRGCNLMMRY